MNPETDRRLIDRGRLFIKIGIGIAGLGLVGNFLAEDTLWIGVIGAGAMTALSGQFAVDEWNKRQAPEVRNDVQ